MGMDVLCQAKSGMGKTAVFVLAVLQQLEPQEGQVSALVLCHTRELAYQVHSVVVIRAQKNLCACMHSSHHTNNTDRCRI